MDVAWGALMPPRTTAELRGWMSVGLSLAAALAAAMIWLIGDFASKEDVSRLEAAMVSEADLVSVKKDTEAVAKSIAKIEGDTREIRTRVDQLNIKVAKLLARLGRPR